jgi:hypothetical protein
MRRLQTWINNIFPVRRALLISLIVALLQLLILGLAVIRGRMSIVEVIALFGPEAAVVTFILLHVQMRFFVWVLPLAAFIIGYNVFDNYHADKAFFEAAAQIVSVLLIALALETRAVRLADMAPGDRLYAFLTVSCLVAAGVESMKALAENDFYNADFSLVASSLLAATLAVALIAMSGLPSEQTPPEK